MKWEQCGYQDGQGMHHELPVSDSRSGSVDGERHQSHEYALERPIRTALPEDQANRPQKRSHGSRCPEMAGTGDAEPPEERPEYQVARRRIDRRPEVAVDGRPGEPAMHLLMALLEVHGSGRGGRPDRCLLPEQ